MKTFPLKLTDELHAKIKKKAIDAGKPMYQYILDCVEDAEITPEFIESMEKIKATKNRTPLSEVLEESKDCKHGFQRGSAGSYCDCHSKQEGYECIDPNCKCGSFPLRNDNCPYKCKHGNDSEACSVCDAELCDHTCDHKDCSMCGYGKSPMICSKHQHLPNKK